MKIPPLYNLLLLYLKKGILENYYKFFKETKKGARIKSSTKDKCKKIDFHIHEAMIGEYD
jgi:hypothetical protein